MNRATWRLALLAGALGAAAGCGGPNLQAVQPVWTAQEVALVARLQSPECALVDRTSGAVFVSNMDTATRQYWADDGTGFISFLRPGGTPVRMRWQESKADAPLNSPKGMCILEGVLYVADNTRVVGYPVTDEAEVRPLMGPAGRRLNDMASDGVSVYVSDTEAGAVYRLDREGVTRIKAPAGVNGITFFKGKMFAVSWDLHEVYELDPTGKGDPVPFGLAVHFTTPDGIEVLDDGTFLVSDMQGNRVVTISADRKTVQPLIAVRMPADIGLDIARRLLYVPQLEDNCVSIYKLDQKKP